MKKFLLTLSLAMLSSGIYGQTTPELVDMGTSVKWATENLGTDADHPYGNYYLPGALLPYDPNNYKTLSHLGTPLEFDSWAGNPKYDAVTAAYGAGWFIPTKKDFEELFAACDLNQYYDESLGRTVFEYTSRTTNNTIRFVNAGCWYRSSSGTEDEKYLYIQTSSSFLKNSWSYFYTVTGNEAKEPYFINDATLQRASLVRPVYMTPGLRVDKTTLSLMVGISERLTATIIPVSDGTFEWTSSDPAVASVDGDGLVTAMKPGDCEITVKHTSDASLSATCAVTVIDRDVVINPIVIAVGDSHSLAITVTPALDEADNKFSWTSSDENIVTVDSDGTVSGVAPGRVTITATNIQNPYITGQCEVTVVVTRDNVQFVDMGTGVLWAIENLGESDEYPYGRHYQPGATEPYSKTTVDGYIKIEGASNFGGSALPCEEWGGMKEYDAATATYGTGWCTPSKAQFEALLANSEVDFGMDYTLGRYVLNLTSKTTGNTLRVVGAGYWLNGNDHTTDELDRRNVYMLTSSGITNPTDKIYYYENNSFVSRATTVSYAYLLRPVYDLAKVVKVESVTLSTPVLTMAAGETTTLTATVSPADVSVDGVKWSSSDESVATVDADGVVTAVENGQCTITATAIDGSGATGYCTVTVESRGTVTLPTVDLGLSVYWSAQTIGASSPYETGTYYYWGSVENADDYAKATQGDCPVVWGSEAITGVLPDESDNTKPYDIATYLLGNGWSTPTREQVDELKNNCTRKKMTENGVTFYRYTSKINGNYIDFCNTGYYKSGAKKMTASAIYQTSDAPYNPIPTSGAYYAIASSYESLKLSVPTFVMCPVRPVVDPSSLGIDDVVVDNPFDIQSAEFDVYDIAGRCVRTGVGYNEARATLTSGVYIFITTDKRHRLKIAL